MALIPSTLFPLRPFAQQGKDEGRKEEVVYLRKRENFPCRPHDKATGTPFFLFSLSISLFYLLGLSDIFFFSFVHQRKYLGMVRMLRLHTHISQPTNQSSRVVLISTEAA